MINRIIWLLFIAGICPKTMGQVPDSLTQILVTTSGGFSMVNGLSLSFSIGEAVVQTAIGNSGQLVFTQGFQQPTEGVVSIDEEVSVHMDYNVWPNPTDRVITLGLSSDQLVELKAGVYDLLGRPTPIPIQELRVYSPIETTFDLTLLPEGHYYLILHHLSGETIHSFKIRKSH